MVTTRKQGHAVVLGAGLAGLLTARVLAKFYESVSVIERDHLSDRPSHRRGVPQGRYVHTLLSRGNHILEELFPRLLTELVAAGAVAVDQGDLSRLYARVGRYEVLRSGTVADPAALALYLASRPFLEFHIRRRVRTLPNVVFVEGHDVLEPLVAAETITGVRVLNRHNGVRASLDADMVVDATGRASRIPVFLEGTGYARPPEMRSGANLSYASQRLSLSKERIAERVALFDLGTGRSKGLLVACEHDTWNLAVGYGADVKEPPDDLAALLRLVEKGLPSTIMSGLRDAKPLEAIAVMRRTTALWRRYDQMPRCPSGLLVIGDALCSLDPTYGQGMTMAAVEALALQECLRSGVTGLTQRFFIAAARHIGPVWKMNRANERPRSSTDERRPLRRRLKRWTTEAVLTAAQHDVVVAERLFRVTNLVDPPSRLQDPTLIPRVVAAKLPSLPGFR